jgi:virginiamycin A acetyltransferase
MQGPDPQTLYPLPGFPQVVFLKNVITRPTIEVGDYTYYDDPEGAERFEDRNVLYHFDFVGDRLVIGKFCAIARGATFIMNGANHAMDGVSTYPFSIFGNGWEEGTDADAGQSRGDTTMGHDVWIGTGAVIMPGVTIGNGAIIGAYSVVASDVPAYSIVAGNPARVVKTRFDEAAIAQLEEIAWWDWPVEKISRNLAAIRGKDIEALEIAG